jgi:CRP-like cAMP-binding protein
MMVAFEISTVGREGAVGLQAGFGPRSSFTRATVQIAGNFSVIRADRLAGIVQDHPPLRDVISRYIELLWEEAQQIAACNAGHDASERLCRWLLQCADRIGSDTVDLTQEFLAQMLGVRRTTVTVLAKSLQDQGVIKYRRGRIQILDRERLKHCACECYQVIQSGRLMPSNVVKPI